jgi:hypothetical protein
MSRLPVTSLEFAFGLPVTSLFFMLGYARPILISGLATMRYLDIYGRFQKTESIPSEFEVELKWVFSGFRIGRKERKRKLCKRRLSSLSTVRRRWRRQTCKQNLPWNRVADCRCKEKNVVTSFIQFWKKKSSTESSFERPVCPKSLPIKNVNKSDFLLGGMQGCQIFRGTKRGKMSLKIYHMTITYIKWP